MKILDSLYRRLGDGLGAPRTRGEPGGWVWLCLRSNETRLNTSIVTLTASTCAPTLHRPSSIPYERLPPSESPLPHTFRSDSHPHSPTYSRSPLIVPSGAPSSLATLSLHQPPARIKQPTPVWSEYSLQARVATALANAELPAVCCGAREKSPLPSPRHLKGSVQKPQMMVPGVCRG